MQGGVTLVTWRRPDVHNAVDASSARTSALAAKLSIFTTIEGARAACMGMRRLAGGLEVYSVQELHVELNQQA